MYFKIKIFPTTPILLPIQRIGGKLSSHHAWFFRTRIMLTKNRPRPPQASGFLFLVHRRKFPIALNILDFSREEKSSLQKKYEECGTRPPSWCRNTCIARCRNNPPSVHTRRGCIPLQQPCLQTRPVT